jgi:hypothetical protein
MRNSDLGYDEPTHTGWHSRDNGRSIRSAPGSTCVRKPVIWRADESPLQRTLLATRIGPRLVAVRGTGIAIDLDGESLRVSDNGGRYRGGIPRLKFGCLECPVNGEVDARFRMNVLAVA